MTTESPLDAAREAAARFAWADAFERFSAADAVEPLGPDDLHTMGECAWWIGRMRDCIAAHERAFTAYLKEGNDRRAARVAIKLAEHHAGMLEFPLTSAWSQRATTILEPLPESVEHGWLKFLLAGITRDDIEASNVLAAEAGEIAARYGDKDLFALALAVRGGGLVYTDRIDEGMKLVEEATVGAVSGELGPYATGWIFCLTISVCSHLADWQSAGQWTEAAKRWCERQAINGFPGVCRVHRAEIMRLRGALAEAEEEARTATIELRPFNLIHAGQAFKELGEIRLRMGEIDAAEDAFRQANEMGYTPQPGMALAQLHRGKPQAAAKALKRALAEELPPLERSKLLPAQVEVALSLGDVETARTAADDLAGIAASYTSPALRATADASAAAVGLADGELGNAAQAAKRAQRVFRETDLMYEAARVSVLLGEIYLAEDDTEAAEFEISSALSMFERIGAVPDADRARTLLATVTQPEPGRTHRVAKTFLFSDIVRSTNLVDAIGDDAWADLLKWHDDTLRKLFAEHGGEEVVHTGDGFFIAFECADDAVGCALAIQRSLAGHRRAHGFAPQVRIGLHATEATEVQGNYHGKGVHEAARIGALAEGGEILASASTMECVSAPVSARDERSATLKGVAEPVRLVSLEWREA